MILRAFRRGELLVRVLGASLIALACLGSEARAEEPDDIILKGLQLRREGRDREALAEFKRAAAIKETPRGTAQIGLAEEALGLWLDAEDHLTTALGQAQDPWIAKNHRTLESARSEVEGHLGTVEIWGTPAGAEVLLGGKPIGKLPTARVRAQAEDAPLLVRLAGYLEVSRILQIPKRGHVREHVELAPIPAEAAKPVTVAAAAAIQPPSGEAAPSPSPMAPAVPPAPPKSQPPSLEARPPAPGPTTELAPTPWQRPAKWVVFGLGVAALGAGVAENIVAALKANSFNTSHCTKDGQGHITGGAMCEQLDRDQSSATRLAVIGYGAAGALLLTALVLHLTEPSAPPAARTALADCAPAVAAVPGFACYVLW